MWTPDPSIIVTAQQKTAENTAAAWAALRAERDRRLSASDYTQMSDWPGDPEPWRLYRQELRDLPNMVSGPFNPIWPVVP